MTERELQTAVIDLARLLGWKVAHFRPALTARGWRTPVEADGAGYPDLTLAHPKQRRLLMVELKAKGGKLSVAQCDWLDTLTDTECCEVYCWHVDDWTNGTVERLLRDRPDE
ncbi:MAG: VRR-NUC domain-containing protein [Gemmatimonadaceae bacterium]|nr:VRR-NUC domain-containing protein [Gemmatimonadaceae bacterium]